MPNRRSDGRFVGLSNIPNVTGEEAIAIIRKMYTPPVRKVSCTVLRSEIPRIVAHFDRPEFVDGWESIKWARNAMDAIARTGNGVVAREDAIGRTVGQMVRSLPFGPQRDGCIRMLETCYRHGNRAVIERAFNEALADV